VLVIEGREALADTTSEQLETALHQINSLIRSDRGRKTLVVWPCNTDNLQERIVSLTKQIGGDALVGDTHPVYLYPGPPKEQFRQIAQSTIATLNNGATFLDLGISEEDMDAIISDCGNIGGMLGAIRKQAIENKAEISGLISTEHCRLWIIVSAGNEPSAEIAGLTRGSNSFVDIDRLVGSTRANIVTEIRNNPQRIGILANSLDVRIFHLPILAALLISRSFGNQQLQSKMHDLKLLTKDEKKKARERLERTDIATAFLGRQQGLSQARRGPGPNTIKAFETLSSIAENNDSLLNRAVAEALLTAGYISSYLVEQDFGRGLTRCTDVVADSDLGTIRLELMWRKRTSKAEIANYVLTKVWQYGQALGAI
jgi:DNA (cytosine-5)-methyltransferase 1